MDKIRIKEAIVVEGKYDCIKLNSIFDTMIIPTNGFDIYKNKKNLELIKSVAKTKGIIILTDSDSAGMKIRNHLKNCLGEISVKNVYLPEIKGKERRKDAPGKEGLLGVEGIDSAIIADAVMKQAVVWTEKKESITKVDFFDLGLSGSAESSILRAKLCKKLNVPSKMSANKLLELVNVLYEKEEFQQLIKNL